LDVILDRRYYGKEFSANIIPKGKEEKISVQMALRDNWWISHILPLQTAQEILEYGVLYVKVSGVDLHEGMEDSIRWR
jgi:hypothetical protein